MSNTRLLLFSKLPRGVDQRAGSLPYGELKKKDPAPMVHPLASPRACDAECPSAPDGFLLDG